MLEEGGEELKRVDHLVYVSLKYTRTVDMLMNAISRMIDGYDIIIQALILYANETKLTEHSPDSPIEQGNLVKRLFLQQEIQDNVDLYFLLRKLHRSNPQKEQEFRRGVTMRTFIDGREEIVNIDIITQYYEFQREFFRFVTTMLKEHIEKMKNSEK